MSSQCPPENGPYPSDCQILEQYRERSREKEEMRNSAEDRLLYGKAEQIRLLLLDVDGVLTDGSLIYTGNGTEAKSFNTQDGLGIRLVQKAGIDVGLITARESEQVIRRGEELGFKYICQGVSNKIETYKDILRRSALKPVQVCYMGDDWVDLALLCRVGLSVCPANSVPEVRDACHLTTCLSGGHGAVRELCSLLLKAQGTYDKLLQTYKG